MTYVKAQRAYRQMFEMAGRSDEGRLRAVEGLAATARGLLDGSGDPLAALRSAVAAEDLEDPQTAIPLLRGLLQRWEGARDARANSLRAWALLSLAECLEANQETTSAHEARTQGLELAAKQAGAARPVGWDAEDEAPFAAAVAAARKVPPVVP